MYFLFINKILIINSKFNVLKVSVFFFNYQFDIFNQFRPIQVILLNPKLKSNINIKTRVIKIFI